MAAEWTSSLHDPLHKESNHIDALSASTLTQFGIEASLTKRRVTGIMLAVIVISAAAAQPCRKSEFPFSGTSTRKVK